MIFLPKICLKVFVSTYSTHTYIVFFQHYFSTKLTFEVWSNMIIVFFVFCKLLIDFLKLSSAGSVEALSLQTQKYLCHTYLTVHCLKIFKRIIICSLPVFCSPWLNLTWSPQISGQNKSDAREPEGLVKITYGIVALASFLFKRAGNSN